MRQMRVKLTLMFAVSMCFVALEEDMIVQTGAEWLPCSCERWLHEDCAEDTVVDSDGNEYCCPFCVM